MKKNKKLIISFIIVFVVAYFFPYSADDFYWGIKELSFSEFINISKDEYLNGRYFGDLLVILMTKSRIIRSLLVSLVLNGIVYLIKKSEKVKISLVWLLVLLVPSVVGAQSIVWASGFANYGVSSLMVLYLIYKGNSLIENDVKISGWFAVICFLSTLLFENITIFVVIYMIYLNVCYYRKNKKLDKILITSLVLGIGGAALMFTHPSYFASFGEDGNGYKKVTHSIKELKVMVPYTIGIFNRYMFFLPFINVIVLTFLLLIKGFRIKKYLLMHIFNILFSIYSLLWQFVFKDLNLNLFECALSLVFIFNVLYLICKLYRKDKKNLLSVIGYIVLIIAPLIIVQPVGPRHFLIVYLLEIILIIRLYSIDRYLENNYIFNYMLKLLVIIVAGGLTAAYLFLGVEYFRRDKYILREIEKGSKMIYNPITPFANYAWWFELSGDFFPLYYNKYMGYDENIKYNVISYNEWLKLYKNN